MFATLEWLREHFESVECVSCHHFETVKPELVQAQFGKWKFNLTEMLRRKKSALGVAVGVCPECQGIERQFAPLLGRL